MTLRASRNKLNPAFGLFKSTLSKNTGIIVLMVVAMLIFCPGFFLAAFQNVVFKPENFNQNYPEYLSVLFGACGVLSAIFVTIANYINFSYLYKKNSSDVFHALPLTRNGLLISRAAAGFVTILIPLTLGYLSLFALTAFYPTYALGTFSQIASAYVMNVICMMMVSAYSLVFIFCAGSAFDLVLSYAGFNAAVLVVGAIIGSLANDYLSGYTNQYYTEIFKVMSPLVFCGYGASDFALAENGGVSYSLPANGKFIIEILAYTAVFFILSVILYNHRKAERGGQAYAYRFMYVICSVLAGVCGGYLLSRIFIAASDSKDISVIGFISFSAGALITAVVYGAVTERGFKKFRRTLIYGVISTVIYAIILAVVVNGAFGFSKRVPDIKDVKSTLIVFNSEYVEIAGANQKDAIALHKAIIDREADDNTEDVVDTPHTFVKIEYALKNGSIMAREFFVDIPKVDNELFAIYTGNERFDAINRYIDSIKGGSYLEVTRYGEDYITDTYVVSKNQLKALANTYKAELQKVGKKVLTNEENVMRINSYVKDLNYHEGKELDFEVTKEFTETIALIDTFGKIDEFSDK